MSNAADFDDDQYDEEPGELGPDEYIDPPQYVAPDDGEPELSDEERARAQGWRPGRAGRDGVSLTAKEFLDKGEQEGGLLRINNKILTEKVAKNDREIESLRNVGELVDLIARKKAA
jgi:hypothetical protein